MDAPTDPGWPWLPDERVDAPMAYPFLPEINNWYWSTFAEAVKADADYFGRNEFPHFDFAYGALTPQTRARLIAFSDAWWMHLHRA